MDISKIKKVYIIGIEGAGTSSLAQLLQANGIKVLGSDEGDHFYYDVLEKKGIQVFHKFDKSNIPKDIDLFVYTSAFKEGLNPETDYVIASGKKIIPYSQAVGMLFNTKTGISVCGSHGKTTTSAWLSFVLHTAGISPSAMIGSKVRQFDGNVLIGLSDYFVLESDEYQNKLQYLNPKIVLINNIDFDHPDYFKTPEDYSRVFIDYLKRIPPKGFLVANFDDPIIRKTAYVNSKCKVISYGINESADYVAYDIMQDSGVQKFSVKMGVDFDDDDDDGQMSDNSLGEFTIRLIGKHNVYNALAVIATSIELGLDLFTIRKNLEEFSGTTRRMDIMGTYRGATIIDDYAHHPTEIKTTLAAIKSNYKNSNIITVFHPHTFTRTKGLFDDFVNSFGDTNELIILDIFGSAREKQGGVHTSDLVGAIKEKNPGKLVEYIPDFKECEKHLRGKISSGDVVVLMGAGDVFRIGEALLD